MSAPHQIEALSIICTERSLQQYQRPVHNNNDSTDYEL